MSLARVVLALTLAALVAGCGFQLRGARPLPFESLYLNMPETSELATAIKRSIRASGVTTTPATREGAQAILEPMGESREKVILSINSAGRVREYQLRQRFAFRVHDGRGGELLAPNEITLTRDITFNDAQLLAKEQEEALLYRDMQNDLVQQILRRLSTAKAHAVVPAAK